MLESYDIFRNSFVDFAENLHSDEETVRSPEITELQFQSSEQLPSPIPTSYRFHLEELEETGSLFYEDSHYENSLVCLSGKSCNSEEPSTNLDSVEHTTNFSVEDCPENVENCLPYFSEYLPTSSTLCSPDRDSRAEESSCVEATKELECQLEMHAHPNSENHFATKGKVNDLQRSALDAIFQITDRPSRVLVLYIASELRLHHVTVKNFFSNARRRVRRAAARLTDPERSKRENRKRKEKRRLAALSLAAGSRTTPVSGHSLSVEKINKNFKPHTSLKMPVFSHCDTSGYDETHSKSSEIISPKRRALMEKLADKVQRSAAQRNLASVSHAGARTLTSPQHISVHAVASDSSHILRAGISQTPAQLPLQLSTAPRLGEDAFANVFSLDSCSDSIHDETHTVDEMSLSGLAAESKSPDDDRSKRKEFSSLWHPSLLNMTLEYQPECWDVPSLS